MKLAEALLKTAGLAHDDTRRLTDSQTRFFAEFYGGHNRGEIDDEYMSIFAQDAAVIWPDGSSIRGRQTILRGFEVDQAAAVKMHPTGVMASKDITVVDFENPRKTPSAACQFLPWRQDIPGALLLRATSGKSVGSERKISAIPEQHA